MTEVQKKAMRDYLNGMKQQEIAEKYNVSINTVKSWRKRHGWVSKEGAPIRKEGAPSKRGAPRGNKNAVANIGGDGATAGNKRAEVHGLFAKYLPDETLDIVTQIQVRSPIDLLWDNIMVQYAAIIRAQHIMHVRDQSDISKELVSMSKGLTSESATFQVQQAWDKQATYLAAQSRAMDTLQKMLKQYDELTRSELVTDEQRARIEVLKAKVPNADAADMNGQIMALADLINEPIAERVLSDD